MDIKPKTHSIQDEIELLGIERIEFKNVSFTYPNCNAQALKCVSFAITKGEHIAIVGNNGAGKTTIIKLLLKLYKPQDGEIEINASLRRAFSVLFQDYTVYPFSIKDNIVLGRDVADRQVEYALQCVYMLNKMKDLPNGIDTPVTSQMLDSGVELSGGGSQRIALACTYASDSDCIVLDEPTSNLDPFIEYKLYKNMLNSFNDKTVVIIPIDLPFPIKLIVFYVLITEL